MQNWFQNRRVKAKQQKRQEEQQVMQVLEAASQRRVTEPSSPTQLQEVSIQKAPKVTGRRRAKSDSATARLNTAVTVHPVEMHNFLPYSSPEEASYASLARSLAQAAAAVRKASFVGGINEYSHGVQPAALGGIPMHPEFNSYVVQNIETAWQQPASAFSDWGSSRNSIAAYTPTPAGQLEDPFEFDTANNQSAQSPFDITGPEQDDFNAFAAAIEKHQNRRPFFMPTFSTSGLMKRRQMSPLCAEPQNTSSLPPVTPPDFNRRDSCPSEFVDAFNAFNTISSTSSDQLVQYSELQSSLAARRKQACPTLLSSGPLPNRSKSFNGALPAMEEEITTEIKSMRRPHLIEDDLDKRAQVCRGFDFQQSPFNLNIFNALVDKDATMFQQEAALSSPRNLELSHDEYCYSPTPRLRQDGLPELDFSNTSVTPESATFDNHLPSVSLLPEIYQMHLPEHQLYKHAGFPNYYEFPSEGSSASSGILLSKEPNAFPFEEFLSARLNTKAKSSNDAVDPQKSHVYPQFRC